MDTEPATPVTSVPSALASQPLSVDERLVTNGLPPPPVASGIEGHLKVTESAHKGEFSSPDAKDHLPAQALSVRENQALAQGIPAGGRSSPLPPVVHVTTQNLEPIVSALKILMTTRQPGLLQAAENAVNLTAIIQDSQSGSEEYTQIAADACQLVFVVADQIREKGRKGIDDSLKRSLEDIADIFRRIQDLVQSTASTNAFTAYYSIEYDLETLQGELEASLKMFKIQSFASLRNEANLRAEALRPSGAGIGQYNRDQAAVQRHGNEINQHDSGPVQQHSAIARPDYGIVHSGSQSGPHMFNRASGFNISGGEFNNVGGDMNKTTYNAKNIAANYGKLYGQNVGDGSSINFNGLP